MKEELYIIKNGNREKVDLNSPSGITLKFCSNIFNDLSKIDCSKSYTFNLPSTINNDRVFDMLSDIRFDSSMYGKRIDCEFWLDGFPIVSDGNLYVSSVKGGGYEAVMTFDVIDSLQELSKNDVSINELESGTPELVNFGGALTENTTENSRVVKYFKDTNYSNGAVQTPAYSAGLRLMVYANSGRVQGWWRIFYGDKQTCPPPVVPLYMILKKIEAKYGIEFDFVSRFGASQWTGSSSPDLIQIGGIPMVRTATDNEFEQANAVRFDNINRCSTISFDLGDEGVDVDNVLATNNLPTEESVYLQRRSRYSFVAKEDFTTLSLDGHFEATFDYSETPITLNLVSFEPHHYQSGGSVGLKYVPIIIDSIEGTYNETERKYVWEFRESEGASHYQLKGTLTKGMYACWQLSATPINFTGGLIVLPHFEEGIIGHMTKVWSNLPNISSMNLIKSVYYMLGGFPIIKSNGKLGIVKFADLRNNIADGKIYDWSRYYTLRSGETNEIAYTNGNLSIDNYYLMANESLEAKDKEVSDVYDSPKYSIQCDNMTLEKSRVIFQHPFNGRYILNRKKQSVPTGDSIKFWSMEDGEAKASEAQPAFGTFRREDGLLWFDVWQTQSNDQYDYLQQILRKPQIVKIPLRIPLYELLNLDYAKPVYLEQLNSYFAIVSIETTSDGIHNAELIKLP